MYNVMAEQQKKTRKRDGQRENERKIKLACTRKLSDYNAQCTLYTLQTTAAMFIICNVNAIAHRATPHNSSIYCMVQYYKELKTISCNLTFDRIRYGNIVVGNLPIVA